MSQDITKQVGTVHNKYLNKELTRREFIKYLSIAGASVGLVGGPFGMSALASKSIRFDSWGGVVSEAFRDNALKPFEKETGVDVVEGQFGDMDTYLTQIKASYPPGGEFNLAHLSAVFDYARYVGLGYDSVLDESKIPNLKNVMTAMTKPLRAITDGKLSAVPFDLGQTGLAYNTNKISKQEAEKLGTGILFEDSLADKIGTWGEWRTNIWYAALYTGQDPNNIQDLDAIWKALRKQQKLVKKYWSSGAELMSLLANEEIYATTAWSGRVANLQAQGHPIGYLAPKNTYSWMEYIFVLKGTDLDVAQKLLNYMLEPDCAIAVAKAQKYPPSLDPTKVNMPASIQKLPAFDPSGKLEGYKFANPQYWNSKQIEWAEKWDRVMAGA